MTLELGEYDIHCSLERDRSILKSEGNANASIKTMMGSKGGILEIK